MNTLPDVNEAPLQPAERVRGCAAYEPPAPRWATDLRLDANEGAAPSVLVLDAIASSGTEAMRRYPDPRPLEREIADSWGIDPVRVVLTNGGDDAIDRVCRSVLEPGRALLAHAPSFEMIARSARLAGAGVESVPWLDGAFPEQPFRDAIAPGVGLVAVVSPNNPTGGVIPVDAIRRIAEDTRKVGAFVLVDLAYVEFAHEDPTPGLLGLDNVVMVRTFSKAFGLAGLRVGYALAPRPMASWLRAAGGPYAVSGLSIAAARAAWSEGPRGAFLDAVNGERRQVSEACDRLELEPLTTQANFVTIRSPRARWVWESLGSLGIATRWLERSEIPSLCRITLPGNEDAATRLVRAIETAADPQAILLDLDGVLADVSGSYRLAIEETARAFGIELEPGAIARAKAAGDANNDWVLTRRLLEQRGVDAPLEAVVERFQSVYLGDTKPGVREHERLIPSLGVIERLAARLPLGIVTGRPRAEAEWFLDRAGLRGLVASLVAMEDAPAKPSPEPVSRALRELGVARAWMVGDTPDDVVAARGAGVVPVGVMAPGEDTEPGIETLERAGAARVIRDLEELEGLLP
ncbi:MAG: aminotransferase class I/II-fold pyridoxal phosphate-dependent enzyme [Phycisphaerales bacterium]